MNEEPTPKQNMQALIDEQRKLCSSIAQLEKAVERTNEILKMAQELNTEHKRKHCTCQS